MCFEENQEVCKQNKWHLISTSALLTKKLDNITGLDNDSGSTIGGEKYKESSQKEKKKKQKTTNCDQN